MKVTSSSHWACDQYAAICWRARELVQELVDTTSYKNAICKVKAGDKYSNKFGVQVGVYQKSVFSPFLFIIVHHAIKESFKLGHL